MMRRLAADGIPFRLAMSITPPLCAMLGDALLRERYRRQLTRSVALAQREIERLRDNPELLALAQFYSDSLEETQAFYEGCSGDLLSVFRELRERGVLETMASAATHGLLPLLVDSHEAVRAQIAIGCDIYRETFGADPQGFWLPECAFTSLLEPMLREAGVRWFVLEARGLLLARPRPRAAIYAPCYTPEGPAAFARDVLASNEVWSAESGYPGDPAYRDFYRDLGFDHPNHAFADSCDQTPRFTGFKYHRVTGGDGAKALYDRSRAAEVAQAHAVHFVEARTAQLTSLSDAMDDPILFLPFDAELFGHWWFEGPLFLEAVIRKATEARLPLVTPSDHLAAHPRLEVVTPAASSWGEDGYWSVWLNEKNGWIYPRVHAAARRMTDLANRHRVTTSPLLERALRQLARELLLAQSSDWSFLIKTGTAREYASRRVEDHLRRFETLAAQTEAGAIDEIFLGECEARENLFPNLRWQHYVSELSEKAVILSEAKDL